MAKASVVCIFRLAARSQSYSSFISWQPTTTGSQWRACTFTVSFSWRSSLTPDICGVSPSQGGVSAHVNINQQLTLFLNIVYFTLPRRSRTNFTACYDNSHLRLMLRLPSRISVESFWCPLRHKHLLEALFIHTLCLMHNTRLASQTDTFDVQILLGRFPHSQILY